MHGENRECWMQLCEQAANEQDPKKFSELVREIDRFLGEKQNHLDTNIENPT